jgi:hypothetical protein
MKFILLSLILALLIGFALGGRVAGLASIRLRWAPLALLGLGLQFLTPESEGLGDGLLLLSFVLLAVFGILNRHVAGFGLILVGLSMNFLVIGANHGMPVTRHALEASGQGEMLLDLTEQGGAKHHLAGPDDRLMFLGDWIAIPPPVTQAVSLGDIVAYFGVGYVIVSAMVRGRRRAVPGDVGAEVSEVEATSHG